MFAASSLDAIRKTLAVRFRDEARKGARSQAKKENNEFERASLRGLCASETSLGRNGKVSTQTKQNKYGFSRTVDLSFDEAIEKARAALKEEGFGVLCEIDIKDKLKEKLNVDFRRYTILGACNPPLAYKTLQEELNIGLLLPCNVVVYEEESGKSVIAAVDAKAMLSVVGANATLNQVASEVNERLQRVISSL